MSEAGNDLRRYYEKIVIRSNDVSCLWIGSVLGNVYGLYRSGM